MQKKIPDIIFIKSPCIIHPLKLYFSLSLLLICTLYFPSIVSAQVVINEFDVLAIPQAVELYNTSSHAVDISGWYLDDSAGTTYLIVASQPPLQPQTCIVISGSLNLNTASADSVRLFDETFPPTSASAHLIDSFAYTQSPAVGNTYARNPDGSGAFILLPNSLGLLNVVRTDCTVASSTPTPIGIMSPTPPHTPSPNPTPSSVFTPTPDYTMTPSVTPGTPSPTFSSTPTPVPLIYISEVMANPSTGYEWIELYNDASQPYSLSDWYIDDLISGGSSPIRLDTTIPAHGHIAIDLPSPIFNNNGDSIRLIDKEGREVEIFMYDSAQIDVSWGRRSIYEDILCKQTPSKGSANNPCLSLANGEDSTPTPTLLPQPTLASTPNNVYLSELYVNPNAGEREWLELYNDNRYSVTLTNWKVRDAADQTIASLNITLEAYRYAVLELASDKMNNTNEEILLLFPSGDVADRFTYDSSEKGISWGRSPADFSKWCLQNPSPNRYNYSCIPQPTASPTPTPDLTNTPTPTKSRTPTPTTRLSLSNQKSSGVGSNQSGDVLGAATSRISPDTNTLALNYTPNRNIATKDGDTLIAYSDGLLEGSSESEPNDLSSLYLYLFMLSLCMMVGGFQASKLWNLYHESNPVYPDMFG